MSSFPCVPVSTGLLLLGRPCTVRRKNFEWGTKNQATSTTIANVSFYSRGKMVDDTWWCIHESQELHILRYTSIVSWFRRSDYSVEATGYQVSQWTRSAPVWATTHSPSRQLCRRSEQWTSEYRGQTPWTRTWKTWHKEEGKGGLGQVHTHPSFHPPWTQF